MEVNEINSTGNQTANNESIEQSSESLINNNNNNNNNNNFTQSQFQPTQFPNQTRQELGQEEEEVEESSRSFGESYLDNILIPIPTNSTTTSNLNLNLPPLNNSISSEIIIEKKAVVVINEEIIVEESKIELEIEMGDLNSQTTQLTTILDESSSSPSSSILPANIISSKATTTVIIPQVEAEVEEEELDQLIDSDDDDDIVKSPATISLGQLSAELDKEDARGSKITSPLVPVTVRESYVNDLPSVPPQVQRDEGEEDEVDQLLPSSLPQPSSSIPPPPASSQPQQQHQEEEITSTLIKPPNLNPTPTQIPQTSSSKLDETAPSSSPFVAQILLAKKKDSTSRIEGDKNVFQSLPEPSITENSSSADPDFSQSALRRRESKIGLGSDEVDGGERIEKLSVKQNDEDEDDDEEDDDYLGDQSGDTLMGPATSTQAHSNSNPTLPFPLPTQGSLTDLNSNSKSESINSNSIPASDIQFVAPPSLAPPVSIPMDVNVGGGGGYQYLPDEPTPESTNSASLKSKRLLPSSTTTAVPSDPITNDNNNTTTTNNDRSNNRKRLSKEPTAVGFGQSSTLMELPPPPPAKKKRVDPMDIDFSDLDDSQIGPIHFKRGRSQEEEKELEEEQMEATQLDDEEGSKDMTMDDTRGDQELEEKDDTPRPTGEITRDMDIDDDEDQEEGDQDEEEEEKSKTIIKNQPIEEVEDQEDELEEESVPTSIVEPSSPVVQSQSQSQSRSRSQSQRREETQPFGPRGDSQTQSGEAEEGPERKSYRLSDINNMPSSFDDQTQIEIDYPATQVDYDIEVFYSHSNSGPSRNLPPFAYQTSAEGESNAPRQSLPPPPGRELRRKPPPPISSDDPTAQEAYQLQNNQYTAPSPSSASGSVPSSIRKETTETRNVGKSNLGLPLTSSPPLAASSSATSSPKLSALKKLTIGAAILEPVIIVETRAKNSKSRVDVSPSPSSSAATATASQLGKKKDQVKALVLSTNGNNSSSSNGVVVPDSEASGQVVAQKEKEKEKNGKGKQKEVGEEQDIGGETIIDDSHMMDIDGDDEEEVPQVQLKDVEKPSKGKGKAKAKSSTSPKAKSSKKVLPPVAKKAAGRPKRATASTASKSKAKSNKNLGDTSGSPDELDLLSAGRPSRSTTSAPIIEETDTEEEDDDEELEGGNAQNGEQDEEEEIFEETNYESIPLPTNVKRRSTSRSARTSTGSTNSEASPQPQHRSKQALTSAIKAGKRKAQITDVTVEIEVPPKRRRSNPQVAPVEATVPQASTAVAKKNAKGKGKAVPVVEVEQQQTKKKGGRPAARRSIESTPVELDVDESTSNTSAAGGASTSRLRFNSMDDVMMANGTRSTEPSFEGQGPRKLKSRLPDTAPFTRIFGLWRDDGWWYPCTILSTTSSGLKVIFDDESKGTLKWGEIRKCELKRGDYFKYRGDDIETETQAETLNEELRVLRVEIGITGDDREEGVELKADDIVVGTPLHVALEDQQEVEKKQRLIIAAICIPGHHSSQFDDRKLSEEEVAGLRGVDKVHPQENLPLLPSPVEVKDSPLVINKRKGMFSGIGFLFTKAPALTKKGSKPPSQAEVQSEKETYTKLLRSQGGTVIEITQLYTIDVDRDSKEISLDFALDSLKGLHTVILLADRPSTTTKFLVALALGIPCVSMEFVATSIQEAQLLEWKAFIITTGFLPLLKTYAVGGQVKALSKTSFDLPSIEANYLKDGLFHGCSFLCIVDRKSKAPAQVSNEMIVLRTIIAASGALRCDFVHTPTQAGFATGYTYVLIDDDQASTPSLAQHSGLVNVEWMKQCLIAGRILSPERAEGAEADH